MPTITVPDENYQRLTLQASTLGTTVEVLAVYALEQVARVLVAADTPASPPVDLPYEEWKKQFDQLLNQAKSRANRYPPGFQLDVSRGSIYEGCGE